MPFDFDRVIDRSGRHANKLEAMEARTGVAPGDGLSMWVADMDFMAPEPVRRRLAEVVEHGVFGYYGGDETWREAIRAWTARRHGWEIDPDWITPSAGVCAGIGIACHAFSEPGEGVVVFPPVYHAFGTMIRAAGRRVVDSPLVEENGRARMDLDALARALPDDARIAILCSPHNPGGMIWEPEELRAVAAFCAERGLVLISDEIWRDLVYDGRKHAPTALAAPDATGGLVTMTAPSKTFNLAGGATAEVIIADPELRRRYRAAAAASHGMSLSLFGAVAAEAAYAEGEPWLEALLPYLQANRDRFERGLAERVPGARMTRMSATYLAWVDFSGAGLDEAEIARRIREVARIGANPGPSFGVGGERHARFNLACPRSVVEAAVDRLAEAFGDLAR